jgi:hypothetical protein
MKALLMVIAAGAVLCACAQRTRPDHLTRIDGGATASQSDGSTSNVANSGDRGWLRSSRHSSMTAPRGDHRAEADIDSGSEKSGTELCDGTNAVRLLYEVYGGFGTQTDQFSSVYGSTFFFIDGSCHFYVSETSVHGVRTGTLNTAAAAQLSADLGWSKLDEWRDYGTRGDQGCPDAPVSLLAKQNVALRCVCGCDPGAPAGLADSQRNAARWVATLWQQGDELTTAVSAIAIPGRRPNSHYVSWPLTRSMSSIADLIMTPNTQQLLVGPYARFDNVAEALALRKLRSDAFTHDTEHALVIPVSESGAKYDLLVRDELPDETTHELSKFEKSFESAKSP